MCRGGLGLVHRAQVGLVMTPEERAAYYALLDLEVGAPLPEVKAAYKELVQILHPDRFDMKPRLQRRATAKLARVNSAYAALSEELAAEERAHREAVAQRYAQEEVARRRREQAAAEQRRQQELQRARNRKEAKTRSRAAALSSRLQGLQARAKGLGYPFEIPPLNACRTATQITAGAVFVEAQEANVRRWSEQRHELEPLLLAAKGLGLAVAGTLVLEADGRRTLIKRIETSRAILSQLVGLESEHRDLAKAAKATGFPRTVRPIVRSLPPTAQEVTAFTGEVEKLRAELVRWTERSDIAQELQRRLRLLGAEADLAGVVTPDGLNSLRAEVEVMEARRKAQRRRQGLTIGVGTLALTAGALAFSIFAATLRDETACETARNTGTVANWQGYLKAQPKGACHQEATTRIAQIPCELAQQNESVAAWTAVLEQPDAPCRDKAPARIEALPCEEAEKEDTVESWARFIDEHPTHRCVEQARRRIAEIPCEVASRTDTVAAWEKVLSAETKPICSDRAQERIAEIPCEAAQHAGTIIGWQNYLREHPVGKCAATAWQQITSLPCTMAAEPSMNALQAWLEVNPHGRCHAAVSRQLRIIRCGERKSLRSLQRPEDGKWKRVSTFKGGEMTRWSYDTERCVHICKDRCDSVETVMYTVVADRGLSWHIEADDGTARAVRTVLGATVYAPTEFELNYISGAGYHDPYARIRVPTVTTGSWIRAIEACQAVIQEQEMSCE